MPTGKIISEPDLKVFRGFLYDAIAKAAAAGESDVDQMLREVLGRVVGGDYQNSNECCPKCGYLGIKGEVGHREPGGATQECSCCACGARWTAHYVFSHNVVVVREEKP